MEKSDGIDTSCAALIVYDACRRALTPADPGRRQAMRPVLDAWVRLIDRCRAAGMPIIYTTPVSREDGADVVYLPTDLSAETGVPPLTNCIEGSDDADFPAEIAPREGDYVFLKRRPSAFYGTGVAELLRMLRRDVIIIGGGATNRGVETSVREAFSMDLAAVVVRECCWSGDAAAHAYSLDKAMKMYARVRSLEQTLRLLDSGSGDRG
jgi:maleamate amidohydrolase